MKPSTDPPMKVTIYLKSGNVVTLPGRMIEEHGRMGIGTPDPLTVKYLDWESVELITQEPWTEER